MRHRNALTAGLYRAQVEFRRGLQFTQISDLKPVEGRLLILALRRVQSGWNDQMGAIGTSADNLRELNVVSVV